MSHELRTPLNSLLILARLLAENPDGNLTAEQVEYARRSTAPARDLLQLINDILDLSKVEAGKMDVHPEPVALRDAARTSRRRSGRWPRRRASSSPSTIAADCRPRAAHRRAAAAADAAQPAVERGQVHRPGAVGWRSAPRPTASCSSATLRRPRTWSRSRSPTPASASPPTSCATIFEAFQQADGTTSRASTAGPGSGLSIRREIARLLGGEIHVESTPGEGSTFTLYLPTERPAEPPPEPGAPEPMDREAAPVRSGTASPNVRSPLRRAPPTTRRSSTAGRSRGVGDRLQSRPGAGAARVWGTRTA